MDIVLHLERENVLRAMAALKEIGYQPLVPVEAADFADEQKRKLWRDEKHMVVFQMRHPRPESTRLYIFMEWRKSRARFTAANSLRRPTNTKNARRYSGRSLLRLLGTCGGAFFTCSAEDLVVHKAFANREQDWADIERILMRQIKRLNVDLIFKELRPLLELKEAPEIEDRLRKMMEKEKLEN